MALPALPLIVVGAAGLAAGWLGRTLLRRSEAVVSERDRGAGIAGGRPATTLVWCPVCRAHMAAEHVCMPVAGKGNSPPA